MCTVIAFRPAGTPPAARPIAAAPAARKPFIRRHLIDHSQRVRHSVQIAFLALNVWLGLQFILWVRYYETNGVSRYVERPAGVEGWLPIAGLMNLKYFLVTHRVSAIHPAAMVLLVVFLLSSLLVKKAFCSWLCPVGTVSEYLWRLGQKIFDRSLTLPRWLDIPLRSLKYLLLAFFAYVVLTLSADGLQQFLLAPFGIIADVKMLNFFRHMGVLGVAVLVTLALLSVMIENVWCRFLCPYGALMGIVSIAQPRQDPPRRGRLHRLQQVQQGLPLPPAGRAAPHGPLGRVHRLHELHRRLSRRERSQLRAAAAPRRHLRPNRFPLQSRNLPCGPRAGSLERPLAGT